MAEKNIKISGIGDVTRADFVRAITDPDKFKEFADQQGWGNKRRQLAWNSLHNYAQGVQNGEINEINDMHQIVDDTGARTNKQEKYNWIGSKFDANGATAAFMNQIAKGMQTATKPADKSLKSIPSVTSYLNQQWFGSNNPDWELFQKNDTLTNGVYGIANRSAKIKEGLTKYKNELTTNGAQYNWNGIDKDALYKNLDAAIASSNVATYAPLGITSDYINNALATRDLSITVSDTDSTQTQTTDDPTRGFSEEELARYNTMTPEQQQQYLAQRQQIINLNNEETLAKNQAESGQAKLREQYSKDLKARQDAIKSQKNLQQANSIERTPLRNQRDPNKIKAGQRELGNLGQLTTSDYAQLTGIASDIASTVASFFGPAGTIAGAGLGLVGTTAHTFADIKDPSVSKGEVITNLGTNLLFDVAGAVPILGSYGKLAKLGRVGKALQNNAKLYKVILGTVTAPGVIQAAPNAASAVKKLVTNPTTITADELRDLATAVSITSGLTKVAPNHNKVRITNPNYGKDVIVHTNKGKQTIPAKQYEDMMDKTKNPTMKDRNEALEAATKVKGIQFDNGIFHNYAPFARGSFWEGAYGNFFGTKFISRFNNASDPETKYIFRPAKTLKNQNSKAFKQGGVIKAQNGIKTGVKVNPKTTWFDAVWSQNVNHILRGLSDNNYYTWLNSMQDKHGDLHKNAGINFQTTPYNDKSVGDYQNLYKTGYNDEWKDNNIGYNSLGIMHAQNLGRYDLYGNTKRTSGDWNIDANHRYKTDSSYSQITDDRRLLGRKGDFTDEQLASVTEAFKNKGYNFALGKNDYYYLSPIEKSEQNQNTPKKDGSVTNPDIGKKSIFDKGKEYLAKLTSNPGNLYNAVETGKYLLANKATNDIFKIKAPNYVISPKHTSYQVMDNLAQQNAYHNRAAETMNQTSRPLTSSGQLQTAAQQESMNNANKLYLQGNTERNTWLEGQKQQSYKAGLYNMESAVDTANANAQQAYKTRMLNEYQDPRDRARALATNRQNWINALEKFNVIDPYVERKNAQQQYGLAKAQWDYQNDAKVLLAQQKYQQLLRQHQNDLNFNAYDTDEYRALVDAQKEAGARYYNNMYQVYGISNPGFRYKKGGKFEDISKFNTKEFYNTIRHSINTATKQSGDLSKLINTLFKKSNKK